MEVQRNLQQTILPQKLKSPGTNEAIELFYSKKHVLTHFAETLTISEVIRQPSLQSIVKSNGKEFVGVFVMGVLNEFLSFVPHSLTASEVRLYSEKIMAHCPTWSTDSLILCLKNGIDGKYGKVEYHWKWNVFVQWAEKFNQEIPDYFYKKHVEKKNDAKLENADLIKLFPKELIDQFAKERFVDEEKRKRLEIKVPKDIVDKGLKAIDEYIEKVVDAKNKK